MTYIWNGVDFTNPVKLTEWEPPFEAAVFAVSIPTEKVGRFRLIYVGESGGNGDSGFLKGHEKYPCWLEQAGSEDKVFIGFHNMPNSTREQREEVQARALGNLKLACQSYVGAPAVAVAMPAVTTGRATNTDELTSARERKRLSEERAKLYYEKVRRAEMEVANFQREFTVGQQRLGELQRQKSELDARMSDLTNNITATKQTLATLQRNIDSNKRAIAADQVEMEKHNAEVQRLDHAIADLMRRR